VDTDGNLEEELEAFKSWVWRRMLKISWTENTTNEEVLKRIGEEKSILRTIGLQQKTTAGLGHV